MTDKQISDEHLMLDFAVKANVILWDSPPTVMRTKLESKFGHSAKSKTLVVLFQGVKSAFKQLENELKQEA